MHTFAPSRSEPLCQGQRTDEQQPAKAEQNAKSFTGVLERIAAADKAYADALKAQEMAEKAEKAKKK